MICITVSFVFSCSFTELIEEYSRYSWRRVKVLVSTTPRSKLL